MRHLLPTRARRRRPSKLVAGALLLLAAGSCVALARATGGASCTHGASSLGPVILLDGKLVGGDLTPHTDVCLP